MHALFFSIKRAHHSALANLRDVIRLFRGRRLGITPARFDMLYAINRELVCQRRLCEILGVTAPTVSRMAKSLQKRGLISRTRSARDRRRFDLRLTEEGAKLFAKAVSVALESGVVDRLARATVVLDLYGGLSAARELADFRTLLRRARRRLNDGAEVLYPWAFPDESPL